MRGRQPLIWIILLTMIMVTAATLLNSRQPAALAQPFQTQQPPPFGSPQQPPFGPGFTPSPTFTPTIPLTPSPTSAAPGCETTFDIDIGATITLRPGVNIRATPSLSGPWIASFNENKLFRVTGGPICADNYIWWQITSEEASGWVAERDTLQDFIRFIDPPPGVVPCQEPLTLPSGTSYELAVDVRVRDTPGLEGLVLTVAQSTDDVRIISDEVVCEDGFNWREVQVEVAGFTYEGWMVEGNRADPDDLYIQLPTVDPDRICLSPLMLSAGETGRIQYRDRIPKNLRDDPGYDSEVLYTLVENIPFEIVDGPVCESGMNWWQIRVLASDPVVGWVAEGARGNYFIRRTNDVGRVNIPTVTEGAPFTARTATPIGGGDPSQPIGPPTLFPTPTFPS